MPPLKGFIKFVRLTYIVYDTEVLLEGFMLIPLLRYLAFVI